MLDEEAKLIIVENDKDDDGFPVETTKEIPVYVSKKSAVRSEHYEALRSGILVKLVLELRVEDFELSAHRVEGRKEYASRVEYDGGIYNIVRTYGTDKATIELICS